MTKRELEMQIELLEKVLGKSTAEVHEMLEVRLVILDELNKARYTRLRGEILRSVRI